MLELLLLPDDVDPQLVAGLLVALCTGLLLQCARRNAEEEAYGDRLRGTVRKIVTGDENRPLRAHIPEALEALGSRGDDLLQEKRRQTMAQIRALARATRRQLGLRRGRSRASGDGLEQLHGAMGVPSESASNPEETDTTGLSPDGTAALAALVESEIFGRTDKQLLRELCSNVKARHLAAGEVLHEDGQQVLTPSLLVVRRGRVEVTGEVSFGAGSVIAGQYELLAFLLGQPFRCCARATAAEPTSLVLLSDAAMLRQRAPGLLRNVLVRLNRVTMLTAVRYLGLTHEHLAGAEAHLQQSHPAPAVVDDELACARELAARTLGLPCDAVPPARAVESTEDDDVGRPVLDVDALDLEPPLGSRDLQVLTVRAGQALLDITEEPWLCMVLSGELAVQLGLGGADEQKAEYPVSLITAGWEEWYGSRDGLPPILNVTGRAETSRVVRMSDALFQRLVARHPSVISKVATATVRSMPAVIRHFDLATDWVHLHAGAPLIAEGDACDAMYVVLQGRLRGVAGGRTVVREYGRGSIVGESEILLQAPHPAGVVAVRDSQLARVPAAVLFRMARQFPGVMVHFLRMAMREREQASRGRDSAVDSLSIAVLPVSGSVPLSLFTGHLTQALAALCPTAKLTSDSVPHMQDDSSIHLLSWLGDREEAHNIVVYQADWAASSWTRLCVRQADVVLLVGNAADPPLVSDLEAQVAGAGAPTNAKLALVLLHVNPGPSYRPQGTRAWIENRSRRVQAHYHVRLLTSSLSSPAKSPADSAARRDFARLARCLTGTAVGLVLGGGGARGMSQLGVLRVLEEEGIPVDMVGGTSIGAFVGGAYAMEGSHLGMLHAAYKYAQGMGSVWRMLRDLTVPVAAYFTGRGFNDALRNTFGRAKIEDLWLPYFCVTTDLTTSRERVHENGTLWRYVRASMSLAGYLPPLCDAAVDPATGERVVHYLCDGGYLNNLPADVMKSNGAGTIVAVDVGADWTFAGHNYGDVLHGTWVFLRRLNPWAKPLQIPSMTDISSQLAYVSSVRQLEDARERFVDLYLRPPVAGFGTLEFKRYADIEAKGYEYAKPAVAKWKQDLLRANDYRVKLFDLANHGRGLKKTRSFSLVEGLVG